MALLERITSMQQSGMSDNDIITTLREEGITPRDINEAFSQSQIKAAVNTQEGFEGMQPSIRTESETQQNMQPQMQNMPEYQTPAPSQQQYAPQQYTQEQTPVAYAPEAYAQEQYAQYPAEQTGEQYYSQVMDVETVRDIAKQEIEESVKKIKSQLDSLEKLKTDWKFELQNMENRLTRVESVIQEIQSAVIRKMGEYGEAISGISKEVRATQNSFSKVLNPLMDKQRGKSEEVEEEIKEKPQNMKIKSKKSESRPAPAASFEDYLR